MDKGKQQNMTAVAFQTYFLLISSQLSMPSRERPG